MPQYDWQAFQRGAYGNPSLAIQNFMRNRGGRIEPGSLQELISQNVGGGAGGGAGWSQAPWWERQQPGASTSPTANVNRNMAAAPAPPPRRPGRTAVGGTPAEQYRARVEQWQRTQSGGQPRTGTLPAPQTLGGRPSETLPPMPTMPTMPGGVAPFQLPGAALAPQPVDLGRARAAAANIRAPRIAEQGRIGLGEAPGRVGGDYGQLPPAPDYERLGAAPDWAGLGPLAGRGGIDAAIRALRESAGGPGAVTAPREQLAGPGGENVWEQLALDRFRSGGNFDPGTQFTGRELSDTVWTPAQIAQLAEQRAAPTIRQFQDIERQIADQAATGGAVDPARVQAARARALVEGAGARSAATRDAQIEGAQLNAEQAARAATNTRENFGADIAARLGLGRLGLEGATSLLSGGLERRGLDQARDIAGLTAGVTQRGQDISAGLEGGRINLDALRAALQGELETRGQDIGFTTEAGRQGLTARGQGLDYGAEAGRQALAARGQTLDYAAEGGRQGLTGRAQDVTQRGQDIERQLAEQRAGIDQRGQDLERSYRQAGLSVEQARARAEQEIRVAQLELEQRLGLGRLGLEGRQQDISAGLSARGQDIESQLGLGRLGLEGFRAGGDLYNAAQDRRTRLYEIDARLSEAGMDRETRATLQREQNELQRELQQLELQQRQGQFEQELGFRREQLGQQGGQFDRELTERGRQFDVGEFNQTREAGRGRDFAREVRPESPWNQPVPPAYSYGPFGAWPQANRGSGDYDMQAILDLLRELQRAA